MTMKKEHIQLPNPDMLRFHLIMDFRGHMPCAVTIYGQKECVFERIRARSLITDLMLVYTNCFVNN